MLEYLLESNPDGTYSILDIESFLPAEITSRGNVIGISEGLTKRRLLEAVQSLYQNLPAGIQGTIHEDDPGITFFRREDNSDPLLVSICEESGRLTETYQSFCRKGWSDPVIIDWYSLVDASFRGKTPATSLYVIRSSRAESQ